MVENKEKQGGTNTRDQNKIKPHLMIFQWAQANGKDHKQIRDKNK